MTLPNLDAEGGDCGFIPDETSSLERELRDWQTLAPSVAPSRCGGRHPPDAPAGQLTAAGVRRPQSYKLYNQTSGRAGRSARHESAIQLHPYPSLPIRWTAGYPQNPPSALAKDSEDLVQEPPGDAPANGATLVVHN